MNDGRDKSHVFQFTFGNKSYERNGRSAFISNLRFSSEDKFKDRAPISQQEYREAAQAHHAELNRSLSKETDSQKKNAIDREIVRVENEINRW